MCLILANSAIHAGSAATMDKTAQSTLVTDSSLLDDFFRPALDVRYTYDADMDFKGYGGKLSMHEAELTLPLPLLKTSNFVLSAELYYRYYQMDVNTLGLNGNFDLHTIQVPMQAAWLSPNSPWFVYAYLAPGVSSEFNSGSRESFDLSASLDVGYRFTSRFILAVGAYYTRDYGDEMVLPSIGILWAPTDKLSMSLSSAGIISTYKCNDDWRIKVKGIPYGGRWIVDNNSSRERVELTGGKVGVDIEHRVYKQAWLSVGAGANVFSNLRIENSHGGEISDRDLKPSLYVTAAFHWAF